MSTTYTPSWASGHRGLPPAIRTAFHETIWVRADGDRYRSTKASADTGITYPVTAFSELDTPLWPDDAPADPALPNLAALHPVPEGAYIPEGHRYATLYDGGDIVVTIADWGLEQHGPLRLTPEPLVDPDAELIDAILSAGSAAEAKAALAKVREA